MEVFMEPFQEVANEMWLQLRPVLTNYAVVGAIGVIFAIGFVKKITKLVVGAAVLAILWSIAGELGIAPNEFTLPF